MLNGMKKVTICVLMDADFDYGVGVLEGVRDYARACPDWLVVPIPYAQEGLFTRLVRANEVQGVAGSFISDRWIESRIPAALPTVNTSNLSKIVSVCSVVPDDAAVGRWVARHFCDQGHVHAGVVSERATYASLVRREGFLAFMQEQGVAVTEPATDLAYRHETGWQQWVAGLAHETAVFCTSDHLACRFWEVCQRSGSQSQAQAHIAALAGVGDSLADRVVSGLDLTSVALPARTVGQKAAARLARQLEGRLQTVHETVAPHEIVVRDSTARFASPDEVVARARGLALQQLSQNLGVEEVARRVGVSRRTLETRFRKAFGQGPATVFRTQRLELGKRLLTETDLSVAEIVARTGSGSVPTFTTLFRQTFGTPPAEFRRQHQLNDGSNDATFERLAGVAEGAPFLT